MSTFYNSPNDYRNCLKHYGVRGMKWGVRKASAYDNIYYRQRYNNKKKQAFKDLKEGKISGSKFVAKRAGNIAGHYGLDPWKVTGRSIGRNVRGWYRLLTGATYRKSNDQEFNPAKERAMTQISDKGTQKVLNRMVQESLSNNFAVGGGNSAVTNIPDYNSIIDYLDNITMKDIERINKS